VSVTAGWDNFFIAEASASAALAGLLVVAISINLARILEYAHLPGRALETLVLLFGILVAAIFGLVPGQSPSWFGGELLAVGAFTWGIPTFVQMRSSRPEAKRSWIVGRAALTQLPTLPYFAAGVGILLHVERSIYWLVPATVLSLLACGLNTWVLLVEIQR
jgi:modulator of FtsH protease